MTTVWAGRLALTDVERAANELAGIAAVTEVLADTVAGERVFVKIDLGGPGEHDPSNSSSPILAAAIARLFRAAGARVMVGDSPFSDGRSVSQRRRECGLDRLAAVEGFDLLDIEAEATRAVPVKDAVYYVPRAVLRANKVVNLVRRRADDDFGMRGALANLAGVLPGLHKERRLQGLGRERRRAQMLVDLYAIVQPVLTIVEAGIASRGKEEPTMNGGPHNSRGGDPTASGGAPGLDSAGADSSRFRGNDRKGDGNDRKGDGNDRKGDGNDKRRSGRVALDGCREKAVFVGCDGVAVDVAMGLGESGPVRRAAEAGLGIGWYEGIRVDGEISGTRVELGGGAVTGGRNTLVRRVREVIGEVAGPWMWSRPEIDRGLCDGCGDCVNICPTNALRFDQRSGRARVTESLCISCWRCSRICDRRAIVPERSRLFELLK